jgi:flagellar biosynthesis chaperone FliJ
MIMADNSAALRRARRQDSAAKRHRAAETIDAAERSGELISFPAIARRAGVSVSLLYSDRDLAGRIAAARDRQRQAGPRRAWQLPARSLITEQSLHTELANRKEQIRQLTEDVTVLRERLACQLGAGADLARGHTMRPMLDQIEDRAAELEADNHALRQRVTRLEAELSELADTLEAARAMNRDLMTQINRDPASADATNARRRPARRTS